MNFLVLRVLAHQSHESNFISMRDFCKVYLLSMYEEISCKLFLWYDSINFLSSFELEISIHNRFQPSVRSLSCLHQTTQQTWTYVVQHLYQQTHEQLHKVLEFKLWLILIPNKNNINKTAYTRFILLVFVAQSKIGSQSRNFAILFFTAVLSGWPLLFSCLCEGNNLCDLIFFSTVKVFL